MAGRFLVIGGAGLGAILSLPASALILLLYPEQKWLLVLSNIIGSGALAYLLNKMQKKSPDLRKGILIFCFSFFYPAFLTTLISSVSAVSFAAQKLRS